MSAVMFLIFAAMVVIALGYPPQSRFLPLVIGIPGVLLTVVQLLRDIRSSRRFRSKASVQLHGESILFGYFIGLVAGVILFGFWLAVPAFLIVFLRRHERESWMFTLSLTTTAWLVIYLIFDRLLEVTLHVGFVIEYLRG